MDTILQVLKIKVEIDVFTILLIIPFFVVIVEIAYINGRIKGYKKFNKMFEEFLDKCGLNNDKQ